MNILRIVFEKLLCRFVEIALKVSRKFASKTYLKFFFTFGAKNFLIFGREFFFEYEKCISHVKREFSREKLFLKQNKFFLICLALNYKLCTYNEVLLRRVSGNCILLFWRDFSRILFLEFVVVVNHFLGFVQQILHFVGELSSDLSKPLSICPRDFFEENFFGVRTSFQHFFGAFSNTFHNFGENFQRGCHNFCFRVQRCFSGEIDFFREIFNLIFVCGFWPEIFPKFSETAFSQNVQVIFFGIFYP